MFFTWRLINFQGFWKCKKEFFKVYLNEGPEFKIYVWFSRDPRFESPDHRPVNVVNCSWEILHVLFAVILAVDALLGLISITSALRNEPS